MLIESCIYLYGKNWLIENIFVELMLLIGFFSLGNEKSLLILSKGIERHSIIHKIANFPPMFFQDSKLRELIYPSIICLIQENRRNLKIFIKRNRELDLQEYIQDKISEIQNSQIPPCLASKQYIYIKRRIPLDYLDRVYKFIRDLKMNN